MQRSCLKGWLFTFQGAVSLSSHIVHDIICLVVAQFVLVSSTDCASFIDLASFIVSTPPKLDQKFTLFKQYPS